MELGVRVELLGKQAGLALLGLGVLFVGGQVEDQVGDDEGFRRLVKPRDVLLAEAREVDSVDLVWKPLDQKRVRAYMHSWESRTLTSASKPKLFSEPGRYTERRRGVSVEVNRCFGEPWTRTFIEFPRLALLLCGQSLDSDHFGLGIVPFPVGCRPESVMGGRSQAGRVPLTQEEMMVSVSGDNVFNDPEFLHGDLGLVVERGGGDNPDVTRGELDSGRATAHREPSEESGKGLREGDNLWGNLRRMWVTHARNGYSGTE